MSTEHPEAIAPSEQASSPSAPAGYSPPWAERLAAGLGYFGLAPLLGATRLRKDSPYVDFHHGQALAVWLVALVILGLYIVFSLFLSWLLVFQRDWYEGTWVEPTLLAFVRRAFLCWLVVVGFSVFWALRGSWAPVPLLGLLAQYGWARRVASVGTIALLIVGVITASASVHAAALTRNSPAPADAYLLYDDMGFVPHWAFDLGFYPIARAAIDKWGADSVVVAPLTPDALAQAFRHGRFVFVLSHGTDQGLYTRDFRIAPYRAAPLGTGDQLQYVYLTGCDNGAIAAEWEQVLAPAHVVTYNRLSAWIEHIYWLLFKGAGVVRGLE